MGIQWLILNLSGFLPSVGPSCDTSYQVLPSPLRHCPPPDCSQDKCSCTAALGKLIIPKRRLEKYRIHMNPQSPMAASWTPNASEGWPVRGGSFEISTMSSLHYMIIPFHVPVKLETVAASLSHLQTGERD